MELRDFRSTAGEWLEGNGPDGDIVISSRMRLARNLRDHRFTSHATQEEMAEIESEVGGYLKDREGRFSRHYFRMQDLDAIDRQTLVERHLISREHAVGQAGKAVAVSRRRSARAAGTSRRSWRRSTRVWTSRCRRTSRKRSSSPTS